MFIVFAVISFTIAYRRVKETNRNAFLWGIIAAAVFIGTGFFISLGFSILLGAAIEVWKLSETATDKYLLLISIFSVISSFGTTWLILRNLQIKPEKSLPEPPPPPPVFD